MQYLGAAVVGLGIGEQHARMYIESAFSELKYLFDIDDAQLRLVAARLGVGQPVEKYENILEDETVDIVSIASYDDTHYEQTIAALDAMKNVFVEKPLCRSIAELRHIKTAWEANSCHHLMSNLVLRSAPLYCWLRETIQAGELGEIYAFDGDYLYGRFPKITHGWRKDVKDYSVMQGGGVHLVDLMLWLTNQRPYLVSMTGNRICSRGTDFKYNDFMAATFRFPSGLIGRITANFGCVHPHHHIVRIFGTIATFIYDDMGPRMLESRDPDDIIRKIDLDPLPEHKGNLIPGFIRSILDKEAAAPIAQHEFDLISACVAADRALAEDQAVLVEYV